MQGETAQERRKRLAKERAKPGKPRYGPPPSWAIWVVRVHFLVSAALWAASAVLVAETITGRILAAVTAVASLIACFLDPQTLRGAVRAVAKQRIHIPD